MAGGEGFPDAGDAAGVGMAAVSATPMPWPAPPGPVDGGVHRHLAGRWRGGGQVGNGAAPAPGNPAASGLGGGGPDSCASIPGPSFLDAELDAFKKQLLEEAQSATREA
eukprot:9423712-Pyramimonas_sp.AAC.1